MASRRLVTVVLAVVCAGALASCARGSTGPGAAADGSASPSLPATSPTPPASSGSPGPGSPPSIRPPSGGTELTLTGQVEQGVEPGCLILRSGGKTYELMSDNHTVVRAGAQVVVTGRVVTGMMSHCMQGQIFQVTSARQG
ncbi:MAG: hypothetical protein V7603_1106 [Micromonosporaceae bacterium]